MCYTVIVTVNNPSVSHKTEARQTWIITIGRYERYSHDIGVPHTADPKNYYPSSEKKAWNCSNLPYDEYAQTLRTVQLTD